MKTAEEIYNERFHHSKDKDAIIACMEEYASEAIREKKKYYEDTIEILIRLSKDKDKEIEQLREAYTEYIDVLLDEIHSLVPIAHIHGWRSSNVERGKACREKIAQLSGKTEQLTGPVVGIEDETPFNNAR
jgi:hypothetical protein